MNKQPSIPFKPNNKMVKCLWRNATDTKQIKVSNGRKFKLSNALSRCLFTGLFCLKIFDNFLTSICVYDSAREDEKGRKAKLVVGSLEKARRHNSLD